MGLVDDGPSYEYLCPHCNGRLEITTQFKEDGLSSVGLRHSGEVEIVEVERCWNCEKIKPLTHRGCCSEECRKQADEKAEERIRSRDVQNSKNS